MLHILLWLLLASLSAMACEPAPANLHKNEGHQDVIRTDAETLCQRLPEMKTMPFKDEAINDEIYNGLTGLKDRAVPCLIRRIDDSTKMNDPRRAPAYSDFRVGDAAFFILLDITEVPFEQMLPVEVKNKLEDDGVYAYFEYINKDEHRKVLQSKWQAWYDQKQARVNR